MFLLLGPGLILAVIGTAPELVVLRSLAIRKLRIYISVSTRSTSGSLQMELDRKMLQNMI